MDNATPFVPEAGPTVEKELKHLRRNWWCFTILGVLLVVGGVVCLAYPFVSSVGAVALLGAVLLVSGVATIIGAFWSGKWSAFLLQVLIGILYIVAGMAIRDTPLESTALLTLFIAAFFMVAGGFRVVVALVERFPQWGWALLNGVVTFIAGLIIYDTYPQSALWVVGLLVGLELLFNGWTWIMLSIVMRKLLDGEVSEGAQ
jgi:uncharacterized membrane protein HdeD (DUF308 family)